MPARLPQSVPNKYAPPFFTRYLYRKLLSWYHLFSQSCQYRVRSLEKPNNKYHTTNWNNKQKGSTNVQAANKSWTLILILERICNTRVLGRLGGILPILLIFWSDKDWSVSFGNTSGVISRILNVKHCWFDVVGLKKPLILLLMIFIFKFDSHESFET